MNDSNKIYFSVLKELLNRQGLTVKGEAFVVELIEKDLTTAIKVVTAGRTSTEGLPLNSIFENLGKDVKRFHTKPLNLGTLSIKRESGFPKDKNDGQDDKDTWRKGFQDDLDTIAFDNLENLKANTETLLFVIQKWTSNLGSGYGEDISFYDVAKLTAAAYICLQKTDDKTMPFLFVSGGVSGIQTYLFDIVSKNAAKNLKGRSFYLHVLVEVILHKILQQLKAYLTNVVYASGGNYLLLVPNTKDNIKDLEDLKRDISNSLFDTHHIGLYTELVWHAVSVDTLQNDYPSVGKALSAEISKDKRHKFNLQITKRFDELFEPIEEGGETRKDVITNEEILENKDVFILGEAIPKRADDTEFELGDNLVNLKNAYQIKLGFGLKSFKDYYPTDDAKVENRKGYRFPVDLGVDFNDEIYSYNDYKMSINNTDFAKDNQSNKTIGFQFYGGNDYPEIGLRTGKVPKTFSEMAGQEETEKERDYQPKFEEIKFKRLAVLRMDVDGLGSIFRSGLPSLAVHSILSRNLDWFFKGYLNTLWEDNKCFEANTQIIYSGGDDLFIVGRWDALIDFAFQIKEALKTWVCPNRSITISGGLALVTAKFPVIKAAKYAGEAEDKAKDHLFAEQKKNAMSMMGVTMNWDYEFKSVKFLKDKILTCISLPNRALPVSFIFKINNYYEETLPKKFKSKVEYDIEKKQLEIGKWIWQMAYDLTRMKERCKPLRDESLEVIEFLDELIKWTIARETPPSVCKHIDVKTIERFNFFKLLNLACIWASYELRSNYKIKNGKYVLIKDLPKDE